MSKSNPAGGTRQSTEERGWQADTQGPAEVLPTHQPRPSPQRPNPTRPSPQRPPRPVPGPWQR
jgi:hypothetical protein